MASFAKCRICICALDDALSYDMQRLPLLAHKFVTCTDLSVSEEERLPSELCQECCDQLEQLYAFRAKCIAADTKWRMEILAFCNAEEEDYEVETPVSPLEDAEQEECHEEQDAGSYDSTPNCDMQPTKIEIEMLDDESLEQEEVELEEEQVSERME